MLLGRDASTPVAAPVGGKVSEYLGITQLTLIINNLYHTQN